MKKILLIIATFLFSTLSFSQGISRSGFGITKKCGNFHWKAPVDTVSDLPSTASTGDARLVKSEKTVYVYDGSQWIPNSNININSSTGEIEVSSDMDLNGNDIKDVGDIAVDSISGVGASDLLIRPSALGNIELFSEGLVGDAEDGKKFTIWRKANEGNTELSFYIDQYKQPIFTKDGEKFLQVSSYQNYPSPSLYASSSSRASLMTGDAKSETIFEVSHYQDYTNARCAIGVYDGSDYTGSRATFYLKQLKSSPPPYYNYFWMDLTKDGKLSFDFGYDTSSSVTWDDAVVFDLVNEEIKIQPNASGNVVLFSEGLVGDDEAGKSLYGYRKDSADTDYWKLWLDRYGNTQLTASKGILLNAGSGYNVYLTQSDRSVYVGSSWGGGNPNLYHYGHLTAAGTGKYVYFQLDDTDDWYHLRRQDSYVQGFKVEMPFTVLYNGSNTGLIVDSSGNVGIGTANPSVLIDTKALGSYNVASNEIGLALYHADNGDANPTGSSIGIRLGFIKGENKKCAIIRAEKEDVWANRVGLSFLTASGTEPENVQERVRITGYGKVGIGTSFPNYKLEVNGLKGASPTTLTISDDGVGGSSPSATLTPSTSFCKIDCQDPDGCNVTISESGAADGAELTIVNISANTVNISDSAGVTELAGNFAMGQWDSLSLIYVGDRWVEVSRSDN